MVADLLTKSLPAAATRQFAAFLVGTAAGRDVARAIRLPARVFGDASLMAFDGLGHTCLSGCICAVRRGQDVAEHKEGDDVARDVHGKDEPVRCVLQQ